MLMSHEFANLNSQTTEGWTVLHRAASFGTAEDIRQLLAYQADHTSRDSTFLWTPIFNAVKFDNLETLKELAVLEASGITELGDIRGWNLLHLAVSKGSWSVIPFLLAAGLDPNALTTPSFDLKDPVLRRRHLTAADIAEYRGEKTLAQYNGILRDAGYEIEKDVFWPAESEWQSEVGCFCLSYGG